MHLKISNLYDSHVHWLGTGQIATGLKLFDLQTPEDVAKISTEPHYFRQHWLVGFGWSQTHWPDQKLPTKEILDKTFPEFPVFFQRIDGHCSWLNSLALKELGYDESHSGILLEEEHFKAYSSLPKYSDEYVRAALQYATQMFNQQGFTHIRDMTCDEQQWEQARALDQAGKLTLHVQENFLCERPADLDRVLFLARKAKLQETPHLKVQGIKVFFDGTLGSDTAYLSKCKCAKHQFSWQEQDLENLIRKSWSQGFEVAVHTIGDEAAHEVVSIARKIMAENTLTGWLNLEHVEVLRPETLKMMKALHVRCHMQPCHWLSDREWLKEKLGELYEHVFPWGILSRSGIPLHFGSDSPVARISLWDNEQALRESRQERIPALKGDMLEYHCFPGGDAEKNYALFADKNLIELFFDGQKVV